MIKSLFSIFKESANSFEGQKEGEEILLLLRRHLFTIYVRIGFYIFLALVPIVLWFVFGSLISEHSASTLFFFVSSIWYAGLWLALFHSLTMYTLDTVLVTNRRIIDSDQHGLFNREVSELTGSRIQDISSHTNGMIETFLQFGDVMVQTAGSEKQFIFKQIPNPERVKDIIMQMTASNHTGVKAKTLPKEPVHNILA